MDHLALFNGIGGFQLAAHWVGWNNVAHVEIDPWCNKLVSQIFPQSKCYEDIKDFTGEEYAGTIGIISGGDPCQPHSYAGLGKGKDDHRYLWPEMFRIIRTIHPAWIVNENVPGSVSNGVLDSKIDDLESEGYTCQAYSIPAEAVGALHLRERIWLVGHDAHCTLKVRAPRKHDKKKASQFLQERKQIQFTGEPVDLWSVNTDRNSQRRDELDTAPLSASLQERFSRYFGFGAPVYGNIPADVIKSGIIGMLNGLPQGMDYADRYKRCCALGNAIVPQVAYEIFRAIDAIQYGR